MKRSLMIALLMLSSMAYAQLTSVTITVPAGLNVSSGTLTANGTFAFTWKGLIRNAQANWPAPSAIGGTIYCKNLDGVVCVDAANSAQWPGSDAFAWINSAAAHLTHGGIVDARGLGSNVFSVSTVLAVPLQTTLLLDPNTTFNMNQNGGSSQDAITYADASVINCGSSDLAFNNPYGGFKTTSVTNVRSLLAPAVRSPGGGGFGQSGTIIGCNFISNVPTATIAKAMVDIQGCSAFFTMQNVNIWGGYNTIGLQFSAGTGTGNGCSDVYIYNTQVNGENFTGSRPCVFSGSPSHGVGGIHTYGLGCQHAGSGKYELELNGNNAAGPGFNVANINFFGGHVEAATGSLGVKIADATAINFADMDFSGPFTTSIFTISETAAGNTAGIHITDSYSSGGPGTNWVANTTVGGVNIPFNFCGSQPCAILGDFSFKRPNATQGVKGTVGCSTGTTIGSQCRAAITVTWPVAFTDANYTPVCAAGGPPTHEPSAPFIASQTAGAVTVNYYTLAASSASWATIDCVAIHN
jgi:hypothetical protein